MPEGVDPHHHLIITTSTLPVREDDGTARFVLDLGASLSRWYKVTILAPHAPGAAREESSNGVRIVRFRYFWHNRQRLAYGPGMRANLRESRWTWLQVPTFFIFQALSLFRLIRQNPDVRVNSHWLVPQGLTAAFVRSLLPFRHVLHVHAADVYFLQNLRFGRALARYIIDRADAVFADGSHVRDALDELVDRPTGALLRPMGVWTTVLRAEMEPLEPGFEQGYVAFVGRLVEKKGVIHLIHAFDKVQSDYPGLGLIILGEGPLEAQLRKEVVRLGLDERVSFLGGRPQADAVRLFQHCRVACVPSIIDSRGETEGMPTVVLEAMATGVKVVGSRVDGIPDVIEHGVNGWLAEPEDAADLAAKLRVALETTDEVQSSVMTAARRTSEANDWSVVAQQYRAALEQGNDS